MNQIDVQHNRLKLLSFLKHIGDDICDDESVAIWPECSADNEHKSDPDCCPAHEDCGICRYQYMKRQGWLNPALTEE